MISKLGAGILSGILTGSDLGSVRASELTPEQRKALIDHYGLAPDANLELRNSMRGVSSRLATSLVGTGAMLVGGREALKNWELYKAKKIPARALFGKKTLAGAGLLLGSGLLRDYLERKATDKYSAGNARRVIEDSQR